MVVVVGLVFAFAVFAYLPLYVEEVEGARLLGALVLRARPPLRVFFRLVVQLVATRARLASVADYRLL